MWHRMSRVLPKLACFRYKQEVLLPAHIETGSKFYHVDEILLDSLHRGAKWRSISICFLRETIHQSCLCSSYQESRHADPSCLGWSASYASIPRESALSVVTALWSSLTH